MHFAWKLHYGHVRHSLAHAYYQGWDLHPRAAPDALRRALRLLPRRPRGRLGAADELRREGRPGDLVGDVFDDAATGQGLLNFFLRAWNCGAITESRGRREERPDRRRSCAAAPVVQILKNRRGVDARLGRGPAERSPS